MRILYGDWRDIFKGFRIALDPRKIILAIGGVLLNAALIFLIPFGALLAFDVVRRVSGSTADVMIWDIVMSGDIVGLADAIRSVLHYAANDRGVLCLISGIVALASWYVWSFFAGGICRIAAVEVARDERIELKDALAFAQGKFRSIFWAPVAVVLGILFFAGCNLLVGTIARVLPWGLGQLLVSVPLVIALCSGAFMAFLLVGLVCASPLMIPTICTEGTDGFDAISRSMSYLYARPWRYIWCTFVSAVYGVPCIGFIAAFAALIALLGIGAGSLGMGTATFSELNGFWMLSGSLPHTFVGLMAAIAYATWMYLLIAAVIGYAVSYTLTSHTIIYMILRKAEDGTDMTEVFEEEEPWEDEKEPDSPKSP